MSDASGSKEPSKPRLCERCGKRMPPQKRGRPRRWCSQQCRQSAYEERHGLESWKDKQPKVKELSDVVEVMSERGARRYASGVPAVNRHRSDHKWTTCLGVVCSDEFAMRAVLDRVTDMLCEDRIPDTIDGRFLAGGIARLVNTVVPGAIRVPDENSRESGRS
jgi:hypothetical protein